MFSFRDNKAFVLLALAVAAPVAWAQQAAEPVIEWTPVQAYAGPETGGSAARWLVTGVSAREPVVHKLTSMPGGAEQPAAAWGTKAGVRGLWRLGDGLSWKLELQKTAVSVPGDQPSSVATIQCERGWLGDSSMTGRNCRVTGLEQSHAAMSGLWSPLPGLQTEFGMFRHSESRRQPVSLDAFELGGALFDSPPIATRDYLGRAYAGVDVGLRFEFPVSAIGRFAVDADLARVFDYSVDTRGALSPLVDSAAPGALRNRDRDFARLQFDWSRGDFSGGIESLYREVVPFDRGHGENSDWTSFNVHFTWRTPWDGALSFGATNLLDDYPDERRTADPGNDGFDSIYGRIPYVRYKQDL